MGDECTCEKCQAAAAKEGGAFIWPVVHAEAQSEGRARTPRSLYLVVTEGGVSLRQQAYER